MAKILVCADGFFRNFSPISLEPYVEMFINSLAENGNIVMPYIINDIISKKKLASWYREITTYEEVKKFNPDIIFTFNNAIDKRFVKNLDCPVYVIASDTPIYWHNKDLIKEYYKKYKILYFNNDFSEMLNNEFNINYSNQYLIPYTTDVKADNEKQNKDVTFIGNFSIPIWQDIFRDLLKRKSNYIEKEHLLKNLLNYYEEHSSINEELFDEYSKYSSKPIIKSKIESNLCYIFTNYKRMELLSAISDIDLHIYTWIANFQVFDFNYKLFKKIHFEEIASTKSNEKIYNQSRIALSLPHYQAKTGFSWRVCDIMASNSMLLTNQTKDITDLFGELIPTYNSEKELRDKCLYYLNNEDERLDIVRKSQEIIDKNHRFIHLLKKLEDVTGIKLISESKGELKNTRRTQYLQDRYNRTKKVKR